jgi:hypothetical protein
MVRIILLLLFSTSAMAHSDQQLWEAIAELKARIERLEADAGIVGEQKKIVAAVNPGFTRSGAALTHYWLSQNQQFDWNSEAPLREGLMQLDSTIKLSPELYGYQRSGVFDKRYDSSLYPVAAVLIEGDLMIERGGVYQLIVRPTPPREVAGAGNVEVSIDVSIAGKNIFAMPFSMSLSARQAEVNLLAGRQPLKVKIIARSPGFGPSPTKTLVYIGLQAEGEITSAPLNSYLVTDVQK